MPITPAYFVEKGDVIDYTPSSAVSAGQVVVQGDLIGIAKRDIAADALGALHIRGVFDFPRATGTTINVGTTMYWDAGAGQATTTSEGNKLLGKSIKHCATGDEMIRIRVNQ